MQEIEKVIKDGKVAVLVSSGYGAGWYSWNTDYQQILFHPKLVSMVESGRRDDITDEWVKENLDIDLYAGGSRDLEIKWIPKGTAFAINEHDGFETLKTIDDLYITA